MQVGRIEFSPDYQSHWRTPRSKDAVNVQAVNCAACGHIQISMNVPLITNCPKCGKSLDGEWPSEIGSAENG